MSHMDYINLAPLNFSLKNVTGLFSWDRTPPILTPQALLSTSNSLSKLEVPNLEDCLIFL